MPKQKNKNSVEIHPLGKPKFSKPDWELGGVPERMVQMPQLTLRIRNLGS